MSPIPSGTYLPSYREVLVAFAGWLPQEIDVAKVEEFLKLVGLDQQNHNTPEMT